MRILVKDVGDCPSLTSKVFQRVDNTASSGAGQLSLLHVAFRCPASIFTWAKSQYPVLDPEGPEGSRVWGGELGRYTQGELLLHAGMLLFWQRTRLCEKNIVWSIIEKMLDIPAIKFCSPIMDVIFSISVLLLAKATGISGSRWKISVKVLLQPSLPDVERVKLGLLALNSLG